MVRVLTVVATVLLSSCATMDPRSTVLRKASFELDCPESDLKVVVLEDNSMSTLGASVDSKTYGVSGCGKRASYSGACGSAMLGGTCSAAQTSAPLKQ